MSFLAGRLAATEGSYFLQESKQAVTRLAQRPKNPNINISPQPIDAAAADVLPQVLKHSLPSEIFRPQSDSSSSSLSRASKWVISSTDGTTNAAGVSREALNPFKGYVSMPQVTFGPKRWQLPNSENSVLASTANELRRDKYTPVSPEKFKAAAAGLSQIAKAFAVATAVVFGGASLGIGIVASKLELHNIDDIRTKGRDIFQPRFEMIKEQVTPLRTWAQDKSKKWQIEKEVVVREKPLVKNLSRMLGAKSSD